MKALAGRWAWPAGVLVVEYLVLSFLVDFPTDGQALPLVNAVRLVIPVAIGAGAAGWLLSHRDGAAWPAPPIPRHRALLAAAHVLGFVATAALAVRILGGGAPPLALPASLLFLLVGGTTVLLAVATVAPLQWLARTTLERWRIPLVALSIGLVIWRVASAAERLWTVLSAGSLLAVSGLLRLVRTDVVIDPAINLIEVGDFGVLVAPVCSGVDGIGLVVLFLAVWISLARDRLRFPRVLLLLPLGAIAAWLANVIRIAILLLAGAMGYRRLAEGGLHSKLGWILFTVLALGGVALAERARPFRKADGDERADTSGAPDAAAPFLAPLVATMSVSLLTSVLSTGPIDSWYGVRIAIAVAVLHSVRESLPRASLSWSWPALTLGLVVGAGWVLLAGGSDPSLEAAVREMPAGLRLAWISIRLAGSVLVIPVVEELAFRGFLLPWLVSPEFEKVPPRAWTWPALVLSSLAFGAIHEHWVLGTLAGIVFAAVRLRRGRLSDAILAHAVANAVVAAAALSGRWYLWG